MKAIEILKARLRELKGASKIVRMDNSQQRFKVPILNVIEAIKELEDLENRSCTNCKYWFYKTLETNIETCNFGLISHDYQSDSFCCNKWKSKK